ncbi:MAG: transposase [Candidatus Marsarchaeota archaeon]
MPYQQTLWYSFLWRTKRGKPVLLGKVREKLIEIIGQVAQERGFKLGKSLVYPNGVYLELGLDPRVAPHCALSSIRSRTSGVLRSHFPELKKMPSLWTRDYEVYNYSLGDEAVERLRRWLGERKRRYERILLKDW